VENSIGASYRRFGGILPPPPAMKILGGKWSKGDAFALLAVVAAILAIPGMPKLLHWDAPDEKRAADRLSEGDVAYDLGKFDDAAKLYRESADQGSSMAMNRLGSLYRGGQGVPQDMKQAIVWFQRAADHGATIAMWNLGEIYEVGPMLTGGVPQDYEKARYWYVKAAEGGNTLAMSKLKTAYRYGDLGLEKDPSKSEDWALREQAAETRK